MLQCARSAGDRPDAPGADPDARDEDRTLAAEVRRAVRRYLKDPSG